MSRALDPEQPAPRRPRRYKSITRIDHPAKHTHGWMVRVRFAGQTMNKFFSDKPHGGKRAALKVAIAFRDEAEQQLGKPRTERVVVARSTRSNTGVQGVHRVIKTEYTASGTISIRPVYEVTWSPEPNVLRRTSVAINKYGEEEAFRRAVELRRKKEQEVYYRAKRKRSAKEDPVSDKESSQ